MLPNGSLEEREIQGDAQGALHPRLSGWGGPARYLHPQGRTTFTFATRVNRGYHRNR